MAIFFPKIWKSINTTKLQKKATVLRAGLHVTLQQASPGAPLGERIQWLENLIRWVRIPSRPEEAAAANVRIQSARVTFLLMYLDRNPELKVRVEKTISSILLDTDPLPLFSQLGLSRENAFLAEAIDRVLKKLLPIPSNERDLSELFVKIFRDERDADWIEDLDDKLTTRIHDLLFEDGETQAKITRYFDNSVKNALVVLSSQAVAIGLSPEIRSRTEIGEVPASSFFQLTKQIPGIFASKERQDHIATFAATLQSCRHEIKSVLTHLDSHGVSVAIVYRLELLEEILDRCEKLIQVIGVTDEQNARWKYLLSDLIRSRFKSVKLRTLIQDNLQLLARKIVERTGVSGDRYIARNRQEYMAMLLSAGGGGILTVGTTLLKFLIGKFHFPPFIDGIFSWMNYSGSFLLMQGCHLTLATKQPSMTAPALAAKLRNLTKKSQIVEFVNEVTRLTRSQFAAALGNIGLVVPSAFLFDLTWQLLFGSHVLSSEYGLKTIAALNPLTSLTIPMAALTGFLLWLSSIGAGWTENWFVYRRIPEAIAQSQWARSFFGAKAGPTVSNWLMRNISGIAGNISLGFFLAFTPVFGRFFGLPLDVRHVTLSSGALTFAICAVRPEDLGVGQLLLAGLGIVFIGLLNFGVSFALAMYTAMRARRIRTRWLWHIRASLLAKLRSKPLDFVLPRSS